MPTSPALCIQNLSKRYGAVGAVDGFGLSIGAGETVALLGPSGCGKSTVLRLTAGLEVPDSGRIEMAGRDVTRLPPEQRRVGMVFQDYALFPHLSVLGNVAYGPKMRGQGRVEAEAQARQALEMVELSALEGRKPDQLSGGQQQRVAVARALVAATGSGSAGAGSAGAGSAGAGLLLLDEPLSNLDERLRTELRAELRELLARTGTAALLVTHDQREALAVAQRVAVMRAGRVVQVAPAAELFARPATAWVADFMGFHNIFRQRGIFGQGDGEALVVPEAAVSLGEGDAYPVLSRTLLEGGEAITVQHSLGPLRLHLSPREMALAAGETVCLAVNMARVLRVPDDVDG